MTEKTIINISSYKFIALENVSTLKELLSAMAARHALKGTILLSNEGINVNLAGTRDNIDAFEVEFKKDVRFSDMFFKESPSQETPFQKLLVRIKPEIITMGVPEIDAVSEHGQDLEPEEFKQWMDEGRDIVVLDTRNDYEVEAGTFDSAVDLHIENFRDFPKAIESLDESAKEKPLVMFCTGGVRCEKASLLMEKKGFKHVYQLKGGILNYFEKCGGAHYHGDCFVFDERITVNPKLEQTGVK
ncbi:MAG: rhodanese-related sulfurtransferase [Gammaproteobacteria bacterium]